MKQKFSDTELQTLIDQKLSRTEIAQHFGVTHETVRYRLKSLKLAKKLIESESLMVQNETTDKIDFKIPLTLQEKIFIDLHLVEEKPIKEAMIMAGYGYLSERMKFYRAKKILEKYERREEDPKNIMRTIGAGETRIITDMLQLSKAAKSDGAKVQALITLGKWIGLDKEILQGQQGLTLIIASGDGSPTQVNINSQGPEQTPQADGFTHPQPVNPNKPLVITK